MSEGIAYQNMDLEFKILSEHYKEKSFKAYGLELPKIKEVLPTNLPRVAANEKRIDNLFLLEDNTIAIVDYEASATMADRIKYVNYIARVMEKYFKDEREIPDLRMIIIYTGDVGKSAKTLETTCFTLTLEQVFLKSLPGEEIYQSIREKVERKEKLTDEELMQLIILPLTEKGEEKKQQRIEQVIELAKQTNEPDQAFVIAGLLVSSDKFIERDYADNIRRWLGMTKVGRIFEQEKQDAVNEAIKKTTKDIAKRLIERDADDIMIMQATGFTIEEIEELRQSLLAAN